MKKSTKSMKKEQKIIILISLIFLVGLFLRTYNLDLTRFEHEMVRDALAAQEVLAGDLKVHGYFASPTSTLQTSFGPTAYYLMALGALFVGNNLYWIPLAAIITIAILDALAVLIIYRIGKEFFSEKVGIIAAALYAVAPWMILHVATISSPTHYMPFFAAAYIYSICKVILKKQIKWIIPAGILFALMTHFHLTAVLVIPGTLLGWFIVGKYYEKMKIPWKQIVIAGIGMLVVTTPFLYYGIKEGNLSDTINHVLGKREAANRITTGIQAIGIPVMITTPYFGEYLLGKETKVPGEFYFLIITGLIIILTAVGAFSVTKKAFKEKKREAMLLWIMIATPIVIYFLKGNSITVHYFLMMMPLPMLITALGAEQLMKKWKKSTYVLISIVLVSNILAVALFYNTVAVEGGTTGIYGITYREKMNAVSNILQGIEEMGNKTVYFYQVQKPLRESMTYLITLNSKPPVQFKSIKNIEEFEDGYLIIDRKSFYATYTGEGVPPEDNGIIDSMHPQKFKFIEIIEKQEQQ